MSNMEASIKTYNRMADSVNVAKIEVINLTINAYKAETAIDCLAAAFNAINTKIEEFMSKLNTIPNAINTMNSATKKLGNTLSNTENNFKAFGNRMSSTQRKLNKFSAGKAIGQMSKLTRRMKKTSKAMRRMPAAPEPSSGGPVGDNKEASDKSKSDGGKLAGVGSKIAGGFTKGFSLAAKGVGIVKNALNAIAPDRMAKLSDMWNNAFGSMAASLATKLGPAFDKLEQFMASSAFQTFMSNIETAISCLIPVFEYIVGLAEPLLDIINQAFSFILENSGTIAAVLMGIAGAIALITLVMTIYNGVLMIQSTIASIAAGENALLNAIMAMNPAVLIVSAIIILIMILIALIATVEPVREAFAKLAVGFIGFIENGINLFLEALAGLAKGILNFAGGAINTFLNIFVNPFIDAINMIIGACNKVFGTDFKALDHMSVDFSEKAESVSESILSKKVDASGLKEAVGEGINNLDASKITDMLNPPVTDSFESGAELAGEKLGENPYPAPPMASGGGPQASNDASMEDQDMQLLREVAERESLNSYTTMTPSVKIDVGSINENADAEKIIQQIVERIIQEMEASAKGVVAV